MSHYASFEAFQEHVAIKYQVYNALFLTLPFANLTEVGVELPVFADLCRNELAKGKLPQEIINDFFQNIAHADSFEKQIAILLLLLQFIERQIVLLDAIEDAAFAETHDLTGQGTLAHLLLRISNENKAGKLYELLKTYRIRIVLTAHPTQFYPPQVLGIIQDLTQEVRNNNLKQIRDLLLQLGKTPFKNRRKPSPVDEAESIIDYLEYSFYPVIKQLHYELSRALTPDNFLPRFIELGFWPGGDRDGNPNVTANSTLEVAKKLRNKILNIYLQELNTLHSRLTFHGVWSKLEEIQQRLQATQLDDNLGNVKPYKNAVEFIEELQWLRLVLLQEHQGLFIDKLEKVLSAVYSFGFHFASIDIRQNSSIHTQVIQKTIEHFYSNNLLPSEYCNYQEMDNEAKLYTILLLFSMQLPCIDNLNLHPLFNDILQSLQIARKIQTMNGEQGLHRYIISNTHAAYNLLEILLLAKWSGWETKTLTLDLVPLFETVQDLANAENTMYTLYENKLYREHLKRRDNQQTVMLGFSDGTKDGGYITANWEIYKCKQRLASLADKYGIEIIFFDGRGGPPARGGGNISKLYRAVGNAIDQKQIQTTIQGQTISSNYGTLASAKYNIEQLFTSGLEAHLYNNPAVELSAAEFQLLEELSHLGLERYQNLKHHPLFLAYLEQITPLEYFAELNIASRPPKRKQSGKLVFADLRAIPFVNAWSQMKQNIPGFYGIGSALKGLIQQGYQEELERLFESSLFFRVLLENAMQSLKKAYFPLTKYLERDPNFASFWHMLAKEAELSIAMLKKISRQRELMENDPLEKASIDLREEVVLPLWVIEQYALIKLREQKNMKAKNEKVISAYHNLVLKSLAANINASRNSA